MNCDFAALKQLKMYNAEYHDMLWLTVTNRNRFISIQQSCPIVSLWEEFS
jgi:hypothetical protein